MRIGPIEIYWNRVSAVVPAYVDFAGNGVGARGTGGAADLSPIKAGIGDVKESIGTLIDNQNGLDETMRRVGAATDRGGAVTAAALELLQLMRPDVVTTLASMQSLRTLFEDRINQLFALMEDAAAPSQIAPVVTPVSTDPDLTVQSMSELGAKEEERSPGGRRIWTIGRVRVYECRVGSGELEVRGAMKEIVSLRTKRNGYAAPGTVDVLAAAISDLAFISSTDKTFTDNTVLQRIFFVPPEYLSMFVLLCMKKQPNTQQGEAANKATAQAPNAKQDTDLLTKLRSKAARAHGQLQSNHTKNALVLIGDILRLLGQEEPTQPAAGKPKPIEAASADAQPPSQPPSPPPPTSPASVDEARSEGRPTADVAATKEGGAAEAAAAEPKATAGSATQGDIQREQKDNKRNKHRNKEGGGAAPPKPQTANLQLPLEGVTAESPGAETHATTEALTDGAGGPRNEALSLIVSASTAETIEGEQRA